MSYKTVSITCQKFESDWVANVIENTGTISQISHMGSVDVIVGLVPKDIAYFLFSRKEKLNPEHDHSDIIKSFAKTNPNFMK